MKRLAVLTLLLVLPATPAAAGSCDAVLDDALRAIVMKRADPENEDKPVWFAKGEKSKLDSMQAQLKTDYLFVVWISDLSRITTTYSNGGGKVTYSATVLGNLVQYPKSKPIGYSLFADSKDATCCLFGKSEGDDINTLLENSAKDMADKFLAAAKAEKQGQ